MAGEAPAACENAALAGAGDAGVEQLQLRKECKSRGVRIKSTSYSLEIMLIYVPSDFMHEATVQFLDFLPNPAKKGIARLSDH